MLSKKDYESLSILIEDLFPQVDTLQLLETKFSTEEINSIVKV